MMLILLSLQSNQEHGYMWTQIDRAKTMDYLDCPPNYSILQSMRWPQASCQQRRWTWPGSHWCIRRGHLPGHPRHSSACCNAPWHPTMSSDGWRICSSAWCGAGTSIQSHNLNIVNIGCQSVYWQIILCLKNWIIIRWYCFLKNSQFFRLCRLMNYDIYFFKILLREGT